MRAKSMILIVIALGCGLVASIGISQVMDRRGNSTSEAKVETAKIFVTQTDVLLNEVITAQMIKLEDWPKDKVPEGAISKLEEVVGQRPKVRLYPGEPILKAKFVAGDTPTELIPAGFRVVPVKVSTDSISKPRRFFATCACSP
jgi:pilus assembly protein CpaB